MAFGLVIAEILIAVVGPFVTTSNPETAVPAEALRAPSLSHWFGTNSYGADVFTRTVWAARLDLFIGVVSVGVAFCAGAAIGAAVGYSRSWGGSLVMRAMDFIQSFPVFIVAMALVSISGPSVRNVIIVLIALNIPIFVRLVRAEVLSVRERGYVEAARCLGYSYHRIVLRHILPNALGSAIAQAPVSIGWALLLTGGLSFVGAGIQAPRPEWGLMIAEGAQYITTGQWWVSVFPGLALGLAVLSFSLAGDALQSLLDVRKRVSVSKK